MSKTTPTALPTVYPGGLTRAQVVRWRNSLFLIFALCGVALASWAARLPTIRDLLQVSVAEVGVLIFGIAVGSIAGLLASSHIIARFSARTTITFALPIAAIGLIIAGIGVGGFRNFAIGFVALAIFGAGSGISDVSMNVSGAANERILGRAIMPIFHAFFSGGTIAGAAAGALAEKIHLPLAIHVAIVSGVIIVLSFVAVRGLQSEHIAAEGHVIPADDHSKTWRGRLSIWAQPRTLLIGLIILGMTFAEGSANDWLSIAMVDGYNVDHATGAVVLGVFLTAMTVGRVLGVKLLDKYGRVPVLRGSAISATIGILLFIFGPNPTVAIIGVVLWGLGAALGFPVGMSAAADDPKFAAARVSAVATIGYFAFLVGPPVIGFLGHSVGILHALLVVLVLVAVSGLVSSAAREPAASRPRK